jgi:hypothetical protein
MKLHYATFSDTNNRRVTINSARVTYVAPYKDTATMVHFGKDDFIVLNDHFDKVSKWLFELNYPEGK